ncbi:DUF3299 domain-containing protein [Viridibacterium curvum]|uniref:DUF3299 domain-containing protein n=1 Tax=Viridibacterium curvum TaxID=1101404 RepID=A0ABP9QMN6_9RHOO
MKSLAFLLLLGALALTPFTTLAADGKAASSSARTITWGDLIPKGWDPYASLKKLDLSKLRDGDPRANEAMAQLRAEWDKAPIAKDVIGTTVRIPGYLIPMDKDKELVKSFLLVPYFGACIHSPPPPSNQIIDVAPRTPYQGGRMMDAVWVTGKLLAVQSDSPFGAVSYRLEAQSVEAYVPPEKK